MQDKRVNVGVAVIHYGDPILTYNSLSTYINALTYLFSNMQNIYLEVIIIDNKQNIDKSYILKMFNKIIHNNTFSIHVYKTRRNLGYAGGCALAANYFFHDNNFDYMICSNNDIFLSNKSLYSIIDAALNLSNFGVLQPLVLKAYKINSKIVYTSEIDSIGLVSDIVLSNSFNYSNWPLSIVNIYRKSKYKLAEVPIVDGMFFITPRYSWSKSGGMDPEFFMFNEDVLLSLSMLALGLKNYVVLNSYVWHIRGGTVKGSLIKENPIYTSYYTARNALLTLLYLYDTKYLSKSIIANLIIRLLKTIFLTAKYKSPLHFYYLLRSFRYIVINFKKILEKRSCRPKLSNNIIEALLQSGKAIPLSLSLKMMIDRFITKHIYTKEYKYNKILKLG